MKKSFAVLGVLSFFSIANAGPTSSIKCMVYGEITAELEVSASFSAKPSKDERKEVDLGGGYTAVLKSVGGDGGESGTVIFGILSNGKMLTKTLWQVNSSMAQANGKTGLTYLIENDMKPGQAELQYSCTSK